MKAANSVSVTIIFLCLALLGYSEDSKDITYSDHEGVPYSNNSLKEIIYDGYSVDTYSQREYRHINPPEAVQSAYGLSRRRRDDQGNQSVQHKDLWIVGLFPLEGRWSGGLGQLPAVQMALSDVNANPSMLPGYTLRMTINDTMCDIGVGTYAMFQQLYNKPKKLLILGAGCSAVSQATAITSHLFNLVQLSYSSASPALSAKDIYKRFFRVFPPENSFNPAKFDLLEYFNWKKVATIHEAQDIFSLTNEKFIKDAPFHKVEVLTSESFAGDPMQQVINLKKEGARIIIGNFYENKAQRVFCEAYKNGMYGPRYAWIITGFYSPEWWKKDYPHDKHDCTNQQLETAIHGYFTADALPLSLHGEIGISGKTSDEFRTLYRNVTNNEKKTAYQESPYGYDSVWAVAYMLNKSLQYMQEQGWNRSLEDFDYNDREMTDLFLRMMNETAFEGVSGPVMFDENGDRKGFVQIEQFQGSHEVRVGVYNPSVKKDNKIIWVEEETIFWPDGNPPSDSITEKMIPVVVSFGLFITMTSAASLGIVLSCIFLGFNIKYRHRKYIKMSSPNLNNIILAGALLAFMSIIFGGTDSNIVDPTGHLVMCKFYNWTLALGFSLAFGAMFSKTWRVHKIFTNKKIQRMVIKDYQLMGLVCVLAALDVIVLTVWELTDPLHIALYNKTLEQSPDPSNDNQMIVPQLRFCESQHMWYFAGIMYGIKGLLLVFGAFLAFETRKVTVPALNDSKFIGMSVYNVMVLCLIGVPIALMMKEQVDASYMLISLFIFFATTLTICLVFVPKILHRNHEPHSGTMWSKAGESAGAKKNLMSTGMTQLETASDVERLKDENITLRTSLEQCQHRLRDLECVHTNGTSAGCLTFNDDLLPSEPVTPTTPLTTPDVDIAT